MSRATGRPADARRVHGLPSLL